MMSGSKLSGRHGHLEGSKDRKSGLEARHRTNADPFDIATTKNEHLSRLCDV